VGRFTFVHPLPPFFFCKITVGKQANFKIAPISKACVSYYIHWTFRTVLQKNKIPCPYKESNQDSSDIQPGTPLIIEGVVGRTQFFLQHRSCRKASSSTCITTYQSARTVYKTLLRMDQWGPKHCRADIILWINSIWLDYIYNTKEYVPFNLGKTGCPKRR
jgi:hypothetical protein